jgi:hypothetical protein
MLAGDHPAITVNGRLVDAPLLVQYVVHRFS